MRGADSPRAGCGAWKLGSLYKRRTDASMGLYGLHPKRRQPPRGRARIELHTPAMPCRACNEHLRVPATSKRNKRSRCQVTLLPPRPRTRVHSFHSLTSSQRVHVSPSPVCTNSSPRKTWPSRPPFLTRLTSPAMHSHRSLLGTNRSSPSHASPPP